MKTNKRGNLIVISGPSGAGKDSIVERLLKINRDTCLSISATTRSPRGQEKDGVDYYFLSREEFEKRIKENEFLEYAEYNGNYYGTPKSGITDKLNSGKDVLLVIEIQGALKVKELIKEAIFIFILPPSMAELRRRLVDRKTEDKEKIINRFKTAYREINEVTKYNYVVINDDLEDAVAKTNSILLSEKCRVDRIEEVYLANEEEELHELLIDKEFDNSDLKI
ncbi:MAG: guanylate kinase [Firmicutes bacterium]|nr:guanylate kinase [Bacillota bacterium]